MSEKPCPTPGKIPFGSRHAAAEAKRGRSKGKRMRAYLCDCGNYHLASWTKDDFGE